MVQETKQAITRTHDLRLASGLWKIKNCLRQQGKRVVREERVSLSSGCGFNSAFYEEELMGRGVCCGAVDNGMVEKIIGEEIGCANEKEPRFAYASESEKRFCG